jgi:hypothetical protein
MNPRYFRPTIAPHQHIGQMDMCMRMVDDLKRAPDDSPTAGILKRVKRSGLSGATVRENPPSASIIAEKTGISGIME